MTEENTGNNIETLAERAKDMLERVRGAADPDALTPPPLPLSTMRDKRAEAEVADSSHDDAIDLDDTVDDADEVDHAVDDADEVDDTVEVEVDDLTEVDDQPIAELDNSATDFDDYELDDAKPKLIEITGVRDENEIVIPEVELAETPSLDIEEDEVEIDEEVLVDDDVDLELPDETAQDTNDDDRGEEASSTDDVEADLETSADDVQDTIVDTPIDEYTVDELDAAVIDEDADLESLDDPFIADVDAATDTDPAEDADSLNLFGRKDVRDDETVDYTVEADGSPQDDFTSEDSTLGDIDYDIDEAIVLNGDDIGDPELEEIDADTVIAELEGLDVSPVDGSTDLLDLEDSTEVEGVGYLGEVDVASAGAMSTEDLIVEPDDATNDRIENVVGLDLDDTHTATVDADLDLGGSDVVSGSAIVAGSAAAAGAVAASITDSASEDTNTTDDAVRRRGRLSDLGPKAEPTPAAQPKGRFSSRARPEVDHDLNDLFLKPESPDQATSQRSFPWLLPMGLIAFAILAIALLFLSWYWAGDGEDNANTNDNAQVETDDTTLSDTIAEDTTAPTVDSSTATTVAATAAPTTEAAAADEPTFESAADLIGAGSNTADFAELGSPLGLQQALEQLKVDENGDPVPFTLLAPSDDAIAKLTEAQLSELATDPNKARELIDYHFIDLPLTPELLQESVGGQIMTRSGVPIFVELDGDDYVFNGNARVEIAGLEAENGSVIVIDSVLAPPTINTLLDIGNIQFKVISAIITDEGKTELQKAVTYFTENPEAEALIAGHTDTDGEAEANRRLSQRRAEAVRQFLIDAGIDGERLESQGFGEDEPVLVNGVEDKNLSRRIEFVLK